MGVRLFEANGQPGGRRELTGSMIGSKFALDVNLKDSSGKSLGSATAPLFSSSLDEGRLASGQTFYAHSGKVSLLLGQSFRMSVANALQTKSIVIKSIEVYSSVAIAAGGELRINPTVLPVTVVQAKNAVVVSADDNNATIAVIKADGNATALSGGSLFRPIPVVAGFTRFEQPLVLQKDACLGINIKALIATEISVSITYSEIAA